MTCARAIGSVVLAIYQTRTLGEFSRSLRYAAREQGRGLPLRRLWLDAIRQLAQQHSRKFLGPANNNGTRRASDRRDRRSLVERHRPEAQHWGSGLFVPRRRTAVNWMPSEPSF